MKIFYEVYRAPGWEKKIFSNYVAHIDSVPASDAAMGLHNHRTKLMSSVVHSYAATQTFRT